MKLVVSNIKNNVSNTAQVFDLPAGTQSCVGVSLATNGEIAISLLVDPTLVGPGAQPSSKCNMWVSNAQTPAIPGSVLPGQITGGIGGPRVVSSDCFGGAA